VLLEKVPRLIMQGNLILARDITPCSGNSNPVPRSEIKGFSKASRKRMIQQCAVMGKSVPVFLTLTYGDDYPSDPAEWKKHLANWGKRLKRYDPRLSAIWRLEPQKRGAPHYHLLIYQESGKAPFLPKEWVAKSWSEVLGAYSNADHLKAGTRIESLRSCRGAAFYVAKYCAKLPEDDEFPPEWNRAGRLWGSFNKASLPLAKQHEMILHSPLEQQATLFVMKEAYKAAFIKKVSAKYVNSGVEPSIIADEAELEWIKAVKENQYLGNTTTLYGDAESFLRVVSFKIGFLERILSTKAGRAPDGDNASDFIDRAAAAF
jgi:hypothetical protein